MIYAGGDENITKDMALKYAYDKGADVNCYSRAYNRPDYCPGYERHINSQSKPYIQDCVYAYMQGRTLSEKREELLVFVKSALFAKCIDIVGDLYTYHSDMPQMTYKSKSPFTKVCIFLDDLFDDIIFNAYSDIRDDQLRMHFYAYSLVKLSIGKVFDADVYNLAKSVASQYHNDVNILLALCIYGYDEQAWLAIKTLAKDSVEHVDLYCEAMRAKQQQPTPVLENIDLSIGGDDE